MADMNYVPIPKTSSCQELLWDNPSHSGWLRKRTKLARGMSSEKLPRIFRTFQKKCIPWLQRYVVLNQGCLYTYRNETASSPASAVSLFGFNRVTRSGPEISSREAVWAFKIIDVHEKKTIWFSASTEKEMKKWMRKINQEMRDAHTFLQNEASNWTSKTSSLPAKSSKSVENDSDDDSDLDYDFIEKKIYHEMEASKMVKQTTKVVEIEETSDQEEAEYAKFDEVEDMKLENERKTTKMREEEKKKKGKKKKPSTLPRDFESLDADLPIHMAPSPPTRPPKGLSHAVPPVPAPRTPKRISSNEEGPEENQDGETYDDHLVSSDTKKKNIKDRGPMPVPKQEPNNDDQNYDEVVFPAKPKHGHRRRPVKPPSELPAESPTDEMPPSHKPPDKKKGGVRPPVKPKPAQKPMLEKQTTVQFPPPSSNVVPDEDEYELENTKDEYQLAKFDDNDEEGKKVLTNINELGAYMVRPGKDGNLTLVILSGPNVTRKYKIYREDQQYYLKAGTTFMSVSEMLRYYQENVLPTISMKLKRPYKLAAEDD